MSIKYLKEVSILYVEDEKEVRDAFSRILKRRVSELYLAENGEDGLNKYREFKPDIIVTDIMMPKKNGLDMIKEIREENENIPIIITSAFNDNEYFVKAISLRVSGFILKPIDMLKIFELLNNQAKFILLERDKDRDHRIIQNIIDLQDTLLAVIKDETIIFANKKFKKFFHLENEEESIKIKDVFQDKNSKFKDCEFLECVNSYLKNDKEIMDFGNKSFLVDIQELDKGEYLFSLTDITSIAEKSKEFEQMSLHDDLTAIYNKRAFNSILEEQIKHTQTLSVIMYDIDHFKRVNDTYGHLVGDMILKELTKLVKKHIRDNDILARWGGEEFMVLLPNTTKEGAYRVAEKLRKVIEESSFPEVGKLSCSFGVNQLNIEKEKSEFLLDVDKALYKAKFSGRNRVEVFE